MGFAVVIALCLLLRLTPPFEVNHDCGWYLYVAERVLAGDGLYSDVIDLNPPLVVYLTVPPVALADLLGCNAVFVFHCFVCALAAVSMWLVGRIARRMLAPPLGDSLGDPLGGAVLLFVLVVLPRRDFGQREHLALLASLPYFALVAGRLSGAEPRSRFAFAIGLMAGVGLALKPYFLLAPLAVRIFTAFTEKRQRRLFDTRRPENEGLMVALVVYALHFLFVPFRADFLATVWQVRSVYDAYSIGVGEFLTRPWTVQTIVIGGLVLIFALGVRENRAILRVVFLACAGFFAAALWQCKGWTYHLLPALLTGWLGLALGALTVAGPRWRIVILLGVTAGSLLPLGQHWLARDAETGAIGWEREFTGLPPGFEPVRELSAGDSVLVLDTDLHPFFALLVSRDVRWASRYACLWPLPGALSSAETDAQLRAEVFADIAHYRPRLIFIRRGRPSFVTDASFKISDWLLRTDTELLDDYVEAGVAEGFRVLRRR